MKTSIKEASIFNLVFNSFRSISVANKLVEPQQERCWIKGNSNLQYIIMMAIIGNNICTLGKPHYTCITPFTVTIKHPVLDSQDQNQLIYSLLENITFLATNISREVLPPWPSLYHLIFFFLICEQFNFLVNLCTLINLQIGFNYDFRLILVQMSRSSTVRYFF